MALLAPYWSFWETSVPYPLRAERETLLRRVRDALGADADVRVAGLVASRDDGTRLAAEAVAAGADAVLVLVTMAVPPAFALAALGALPRMPVVVWAAPGAVTRDGGFDHTAITTGGATVGAPMLTSMLVRAGRPFDLVVAPAPDGAPAAAAALRAAAAAGRLARARIGRIGVPIDGYDCVDADAERLREATGITLVPIAPAEVRDAFAAVGAARVESLERDVRAAHDVADGAEAGLHGSLRAALALEDVVAAHRLDAGAMNCHVPEIRLGAPMGLAPCFGLGRLTTAGVPWTCAGDVLTAVAMLTTKLLGGAALYHELEALDAAGDELVIANSGEHDLAFAPGERPEIVKNGWFPHDAGRGVCVRLSAPAGAATLVAFAQIDAPRGFRFVAGRGAFTGSAFPATGTANAGFRFSAGPAPAVWARWARAGANHHSSATPGDLAPGVEAVARHLSVECVTV